MVSEPVWWRRQHLQAADSAAPSTRREIASTLAMADAHGDDVAAPHARETIIIRQLLGGGGSLEERSRASGLRPERVLASLAQVINNGQTTTTPEPPSPAPKRRQKRKGRPKRKAKAKERERERAHS